MTCERFAAYDSHHWFDEHGQWRTEKVYELTQRGILVNKTETQHPSPSVVAVHMSHVRACQDAFAHSPHYQWVVILEDDFVFVRDPRNIPVDHPMHMLDIVHLHSRAKQGFGREGYAISRRGCALQAVHTLPMTRPGDLTLMGKSAKKYIRQEVLRVPCVREDRATLGSPKNFEKYVCDRHTVHPFNTSKWPGIKHVGTPSQIRNEICKKHPFVMIRYEEGAIPWRTHCLYSTQDTRSIWVVKENASTIPAKQCIPSVRWRWAAFFEHWRSRRHLKKRMERHQDESAHV